MRISQRGVPTGSGRRAFISPAVVALLSVCLTLTLGFGTPSIATAVTEPSTSTGPTPAPTPWTQDEMDRRAGDTTPDEAIVEEGVLDRPHSASLAGWDAGNIISDQVFHDAGTMNASQIQSFFAAKVPTCRSGYVCLKDFRMTTNSRAADAYCTRGYQGASNELAATIIAKVAAACNINPRVLIVMLQKEQGLVTHTWPSTFRYTIAMGMACPDTSACDTAYYGFQNQVFGAARQLQVYRVSSYFNWYPVGQTSRVQWHPNAGCGSGAVTIRNSATAGLYYYTPYQPNAAALAAGFGTGDSCSSYGNRNFYNYFTDWFGSTRSTAGRLVSNGGKVYLLTGSYRYVVTSTTAATLRAAFGTEVSVSSTVLAGYTDRGTALPYIRNANDGSVSFLQGGSRHHFATCELVAKWGGRCGSETVLAAADYARIAAGPSMTTFGRKVSGGAVYRIEGSTAYPVYNAANAAAMNNGVQPYAAVLPATVAGRLAVGRVLWAPGRFIQPANSSAVYLVTWDARLIHLPAWAFQAELGLPRVYDSSVSGTHLAGYRNDGALTQFVRCGGTTYLPTQGVLRRVTATGLAGFPAMTLDTMTCRELRFSGAAALDQVFVRGVGQSDVYVAMGGRWRHVLGPSTLLNMTGGRGAVILPLAPAMIDKLPKGDGYRQTVMRPGAVIQTSGTNPVYLADGPSRYWLKTWDIGTDLDLRARHAVIPAGASASFYPVHSRPLTPVLQCHDGTWVGSAGKVYKMPKSSLHGILPLPIAQPETCTSLNRQSTPIVQHRLFVKVGSTIYVASNGTLRPVQPGESLAALNGGTTPRVLSWTAGSLQAIQQRW